jgi:hypothetical protein
MAISALLVVVAVAAVIVPISLRHVGRGAPMATARPPVGNLAGTLVVYAAEQFHLGNPPLIVYEVSASTGARLVAPTFHAGRAAFLPVATGSTIVGVVSSNVVGHPDYGHAMAFTVGSTSVTQLGPATTAFAGARTGTVWLFLHRGLIQTGSGTNGFCTVRLESVEGRLLVGPASMPCGTTVLGAVTGGLLLRPHGQPPEVWYPSDASHPVKLAGFEGESSAGATVVAAGWNQGTILRPFCSGPCPFHLFDSATRAGRTFAVQAPSGMSFGSSVSLSPDGRFMALTAISDSAATELEGNQRGWINGPPSLNADLVVVQVSSGLIALIRAMPGGSNLQWSWSPDGSYVFGAGPGDLPEIEAIPAWSDTAPVHTIIPSSIPHREQFRDYVTVSR